MNPIRRRILALRNERNKFGVPCGAEISRGVREELKHMLDDGLIVHLDRAVVSAIAGECDIYLLTPAGVTLCNAERIPQPK
jgi:hypothetical protein